MSQYTVIQRELYSYYLDAMTSVSSAQCERDFWGGRTRLRYSEGETVITRRNARLK